MVICPIARAVHCSGCILVKFCPAKTILGDFGKVEAAETTPEPDSERGDEQPSTSGDA